MKKELRRIFALAIAAVMIGLHLSSGTLKYPITKPYVFPVVPNTPEWVALETNLDKIDACAIPEEITSKMTTEALLETYLTHPMSFIIMAFDSYRAGFELLKTQYHFGLDDLMKREDLCEVVLKRYKKIELYKGSVDETLTYEEKLIAYKEGYDNADAMMLLELLAAQIDFTDCPKHQEKLEKLIFKKNADKEKYDFYEKKQWMVTYEWALQKERMLERYGKR